MTGTRVTKVNWFSAVPRPPPGRRPLPGRAGVPGRGRGARPQPGRRPGDEHRDRRRGEPGLEARRRPRRAGGPRPARLLRGRADPVRPVAGADDRPGVRGRRRPRRCSPGWSGPSSLPFILPLALRFAAARRAQFRLVSQVRIAYRESPLSDGSAGEVHAGDRLPWVEGADNFAPLASLDWQVHVYGTAPAALREFAAERQAAAPRVAVDTGRPPRRARAGRDLPGAPGRPRRVRPTGAGRRGVAGVPGPIRDRRPVSAAETRSRRECFVGSLLQRLVDELEQRLRGRDRRAGRGRR